MTPWRGAEFGYSRLLGSSRLLNAETHSCLTLRHGLATIAVPLWRSDEDMHQLPIESVPLISLALQSNALPAIRRQRSTKPGAGRPLPKLAGMMKSLQDHGLLVPPVVWKRIAPGGQVDWIVLDGVRRVEALQTLQAEAQMADEPFALDRINVMVFVGDADEAALRHSAILHLSTAPLHRADAAAASWAIEPHGRPWTQDLIASLIGRDQTWVSTSRALASGKALARSVFDRFRGGDRITYTEAIDMAEHRMDDGRPDEARQTEEADEVETKPTPEKGPPRGPGPKGTKRFKTAQDESPGVR